ncbi:MAG: class 1 fructose-bisphosphatase [Gemmatimonadetes bacterium]|nr:class 1 fructose-bisphosphatase [Gemmatimonadota bacterium]
MPKSELVTIERFILEHEQLHGGATGELSTLLYYIALAAKVIAREVRSAGLLGILGSAGRQNVQGEEQQKLDVIANDAIKDAVGRSGRIAVMVSEEDEGPIQPPAGTQLGKYVLLYDPLDGSSNIDVNVSIGTIFSIHRRVTRDGPGAVEDCLQIGRKQVAAGYVLYGPSTILVYAAGDGVHSFTLEPNIGEFLLQRTNIQVPRSGKYYSINESYYGRWSEGYRKVVDTFKGMVGKGGGGGEPKNARYIGSLVADFHRNLLHGGVFLYPGDAKAPSGKLRLLYEAAPLAFVVDQAGGAATDGRQPILDIVPTDLHQRTPLVIGSKDDVEFVTRMVAAG